MALGSLSTHPVATKLKVKEQSAKEVLRLCFVFAVGLSLYFFAHPEGVSQEGWILFSVFVSTILAIVVKPLPMGAVSILAVSCLVTTKAVELHTVLQGFSNDLIWLIVMSCFLARGFIKTGLGRRIAYAFVSLFGGTPLGLGYGFLLSATTMAPLIPSATARTAGITLPVLESIIDVINDEKKGTRIAEFLTIIVLNGSVISSCMFLTSNGGNPIAAKFARDFGIHLSWGTWALAAIVPALISVALIPLIVKWVIPCHVPDAGKVRRHAKEELHAMGPMGSKEKITIGVFALLVLFWSCGNFFSIQATEAAILGVGLFLITRVLSWKDVLNEELAWDTFFWMAILIMMAAELRHLGVVTYFTERITSFIPCYNWQIAFAVLALIYFYTHYFFASTTAHLSSMFTPFVGILLSLGAPPLATAFAFAFMTNLFGGFTQYSSGPAPILYAQGHIDLKTWLKVGAVTGVAYLIIWLGIGSCWWHFIGLL